jgi:hypothetical protein
VDEGGGVGVVGLGVDDEFAYQYLLDWPNEK